MKKTLIATMLILIISYSNRSYLYMFADVTTYFIKCNYLTQCHKSEAINESKVYHAGGGIDNKTYTNSIEALNRNYNNHSRFFELDFSTTADNKIIITHGTEQNYLYGKRNDSSMSYADFIHAKRTDGLTQMSIDDLHSWLISHKDANIITDVKNNNYEVLSMISKKFPDITPQLIVQIYKFKEYPAVTALGFKKVIYTNYFSAYPLSLVNWFYHSSGVSALTIPKEFIDKVFVLPKQSYYIHTINDCSDYQKILQNGAKGVYTDWLSVDCK